MAHRRILEGVPKLGFGPQSDVFCSGLAIVLQHLDAGMAYEQLICTSGRAFLICWNDAMFLWDRHLPAPDPDPEYYLRDDLESAQRAVTAAGFAARILTHAGCREPLSAAAAPPRDTEALRRLVLGSLDDGRPVLALMSAVAQPWAPEWCLLTGYDDDGATIVGWSCFQDEAPARDGLGFEPDGALRKPRWETDTLAVVSLQGEPAARDGAALERQALAHGTALSHAWSRGLEARGASAYDAWATSLRAEDLAHVDDEVLRGRLRYHRHWVGHLAAQKWYTSSFLKDTQNRVWSTADVLHAAACYARIHELMWEVWKVAGGYWRDEDGELAKFRDLENRVRITDLVRAAGAQDAAAVTHLEGALASWDRSHADYLET